MWKLSPDPQPLWLLISAKISHFLAHGAYQSGKALEQTLYKRGLALPASRFRGPGSHLGRRAALRVPRRILKQLARVPLDAFDRKLGLLRTDLS